MCWIFKGLPARAIQTCYFVKGFSAREAQRAGFLFLQKSSYMQTFPRGKSAPKMLLQNLPFQSQDRLREVKFAYHLPGPLINLDGQRNHLHERLRLFFLEQDMGPGGSEKIEKKKLQPVLVRRFSLPSSCY